ncbi:glycosyltransferase family 2 protein [Clostridium grantii]|uniref:Glycosyl transferase family 2 n=1 Tax=Clostridium grantii DSM 8605 TaxID=1121316 RepID=A0A1M5UZG3_9CLOT|nr:glycosyltransferase family 2 protein [Clostridium grantii]SHH68316.1 Glycosyl transferase family 2 [Clostridium grantii DSM 8605]
MLPKVSVIIPVYNCEKYIANCLESVLNQSYTNIEVVIINDGSKDRSQEIIKTYELIDKRIKLLNQENKGPSEARNNGLTNATGEYLVFVDSDDTIHEIYIEKLLYKSLEGGYDIVCCGYNEESKNGMISYNDFWFNKEKVLRNDFAKYICSGVGGTIWGKIFKRNIIVENNIRMDSKIFMCEDLLFVLNYCLYCNTFAAIPDFLYHYNRLNNYSITSNINISYLKNNITVIQNMESLLIDIGIYEAVIEEIVISRVQSLVMGFIFIEAQKFLNNKSHYCIKNIESIIGNEYVSSYKKSFEVKDGKDKLIMPFVKNNKYFMVFLISITIETAKKFKNIKAKVN